MLPPELDGLILVNRFDGDQDSYSSPTSVLWLKKGDGFEVSEIGSKPSQLLD